MIRYSGARVADVRFALTSPRSLCSIIDEKLVTLLNAEPPSHVVSQSKLLGGGKNLEHVISATGTACFLGNS